MFPPLVWFCFLFVCLCFVFRSAKILIANLNNFHMSVNHTVGQAPCAIGNKLQCLPFVFYFVYVFVCKSEFLFHFDMFCLSVLFCFFKRKKLKNIKLDG